MIVITSWQSIYLGINLQYTTRNSLSPATGNNYSLVLVSCRFFVILKGLWPRLLSAVPSSEIYYDTAHASLPKEKAHAQTVDTWPFSFPRLGTRLLLLLQLLQLQTTLYQAFGGLIKPCLGLFPEEAMITCIKWLDWCILLMKCLEYRQIYTQFYTILNWEGWARSQVRSI